MRLLVRHAFGSTGGAVATVEIALPAERVHVGENMVQLRLPTTGSIARPSSAGGAVPNAGVVIDWLRLGDATDPHANDAPPTPESLASIDGSHVRLSIPDGWTLGYTMEVPEGAHLTGVGEGSIEVVARRDGEGEVRVGSVRAVRFDLDLSALEGDVARVEMALSTHRTGPPGAQAQRSASVCAALLAAPRCSRGRCAGSGPQDRCNPSA